MIVREVSAADTAPLRSLVLRGDAALPLPGDDEPAFHLGCFEGEYDGSALLGTGNVRLDPLPFMDTAPFDVQGAGDASGWRLRGMATAPEHRDRGVGALVLAGLVQHCRTQGGALLWCNARTPAQRFYERAGLVVVGDRWDDPAIGPHVRMWLRL